MRVKVIAQYAGQTLIEWVDEAGLNRSIVPAADVVGGECERPERGVPYGEDWAALLISIGLNVDLLVVEFHRRGIWTFSDLQANHNAALGAILAVAGRLLGDLVGMSKALKARR